MGLIRAGIGALGGTLADQWKEFFYCEAIDKDVLMVKGRKQTSRRSSNTKGNDNIISNGSGIAVADGQCMIIVEQGKVVEVCAEPGQFTYDTSTEPSIFTGPLGKGILNTFKTIGKRFTYGGDTAKDQRVYYFNTKEITDNKFGTATPILFRVVDHNVGLDMDMGVRCNGIYSYKIADPLRFYTNLSGNVADEYPRSEIDAQLKGEFISALQPALAKLSEKEIRPSAIPAHAEELCQAMNEKLSQKWGELRGIEVVSIAMNPVSLSDEDAKTLREAQKAGMYRDPRNAAANLASAQMDAMRTAAGNSAGAMTGFMGFGMAQQAGGMNAQNMFAEAQRQEELHAQQAPQPSAPPAGSWKCSCGAIATGKFCAQCGAKKPEAKPENGWKCECGTVNTGKFCMQCGKPRPQEGWKCKCGAVNKGKFCSECGAKKPDDEPLYKCDKCGWEPADPKHPPKFCPECGDIFDDRDKQ